MNLNSFLLGSSLFYEALWKTLILDNKSVASYAALVANTFGIIVNASQYSEMATYSLLPYWHKISNLY